MIPLSGAVRRQGASWAAACWALLPLPARRPTRKGPSPCAGVPGTNASVFAHAAAQVKKAMEVTHELGGAGYVFWGGREGYGSLLNTEMTLELDNLARFLKSRWGARVHGKCRRRTEPAGCQRRAAWLRL